MVARQQYSIQAQAVQRIKTDGIGCRWLYGQTVVVMKARDVLCSTMLIHPLMYVHWSSVGP